MDYFHGTAGGDTLAKFALNPSSRGRNQARKVRGAPGVADVSDDVAVIKTFKWDWKRSMQKEAGLHVRLPQDIFRKRYDAKTWSTRHLDPDLWDVLAFAQHEVTLQNGTGTTIGVGLYSDKVTLSRTENFLRISIGPVWKGESSPWPPLFLCFQNHHV